jgi:hypothetical protein
MTSFGFELFTDLRFNVIQNAASKLLVNSLFLSFFSSFWLVTFYSQSDKLCNKTGTDTYLRLSLTVLGIIF